MKKDIQHICKQLEKLAREHNISCEVYAEGEIVCVEISWGDWKHDHLRLQHLVEKELTPLATTTVITEENGSDAYSAIHRFLF